MFDAKSTAEDVVEGVDLSGRCLLVTGANAGIGWETARVLAGAGARVYVGARSNERAEDAIQRIRARHPEADVRPFVADLGSLADCARAAESLDEPALHGFIANAGLVAPSFGQTADGFERTVGVCHFGHAALFRGLQDRLLAGAPSRVVMVSSESHRGEKNLDPERLSLDADEYSMLAAYNRAKLCNVLFASEVDRRFGDRGLHAFSLHPGTFIATRIGRESWLAWLATQLYRPWAKNLSQGAATQVLAAVHPSLEGHGGAYLNDTAVGRASRSGEDADLARRLWEATERTLDEVQSA
ncbi:MAG: SDR family NAD(P)-dependent oxidoreductase [Myxococcota bacterium]